MRIVKIRATYFQCCSLIAVCSSGGRSCCGRARTFDPRELPLLVLLLFLLLGFIVVLLVTTGHFHIAVKRL